MIEQKPQAATLEESCPTTTRETSVSLGDVWAEDCSRSEGCWGS
ncbi:hypothetical protein SynA1528_01151 [Synechococcus sp. A15-28]|nr:hypothetical protein SynA1528_01151 [Synechococcus sp. A15-28]